MFVSLQVEHSILIFGILIAFFAISQSPIVTVNILLIVAPLRVLIQTESPTSIPIDIAQGLFVLLLGSMLIEAARNTPGYIPLQLSKLVFILIPYFVALSLSLITAFSAGAWLREWLKWLVVVLLIIFIPALSSTLKWQWVVFGLTLAALANALVGFYIFLGGSGALHLVINDRFFRAFGTFGQPNPFGGFMGMIAPLTIMTAYGYCGVTLIRALKVKRVSVADIVLSVFYALSAIIIVIALFMSWSRGAWLGFLVSAFSMVVALPRRWWQSVSIMGMMLVAGIILWNSGLLPSAIVERVSSATTDIFVLSDVRAVDITPDNFAIVERLAHWQVALDIGRSHLWLGVGAGNYPVAYDSFRLLNWHEPLGHAHNFYLNVLAETGIIGLLSYGWALVGILVLTYYTKRHPDFVARSVIIGFLGTWVYVIVHSLTDNLFVNNMFVHFGVMLGILAVLHKETTGVVRI